MHDQRVQRDLDRVIDVCQSQMDKEDMTLGPFCYTSTDVVPTSFGTVYSVDATFGGIELGVNPQLGKDVVVGHVEIALEIHVKS